MDKTGEFLGQIGIAEAGIWIIDERWNKKKQRGLIRVGNKHVDKLKTALALIDKINNQKIIIKTLGVSGVLKKAEEKYLAA